MKLCANCRDPLGDSGRRDLCSRCYWQLPAPTRAAYEGGRAETKQVLRAIRERFASCREFDGGKRRKA